MNKFNDPEYIRQYLLDGYKAKKASSPKYICADCAEECEIVEETFNYAGTHCTYGLSGTHCTGHYVSKCCCAEVDEV